MNLDYLEKVKKSTALQDIEWWNCKKDLYYFLTNWAFTLDVHDPKNITKPFPKKKYIMELCKIWTNNNLLLVPKSRQMMMSWFFTTVYLWEAQFNEGKLTFFQSKKADDADDLIKRAKTVYDNEPSFLKRFYSGGKFYKLHINPSNGGKSIYCKIQFPEIKSEIRGIPEGGDVIRMHTASGILSDEMAFQPAAKSAYTGAKPTISSKGRFTGVSTAEDNTFFEHLVFDKNV